MVLMRKYIAAAAIVAIVTAAAVTRAEEKKPGDAKPTAKEALQVGETTVEVLVCRCNGKTYQVQGIGECPCPEKKKCRCDPEAKATYRVVLKTIAETIETGKEIPFLLGIETVTEKETRPVAKAQVGARFLHQVHGYRCAMGHPPVESLKPGKCPKCGMALAEAPIWVPVGKDVALQPLANPGIFGVVREFEEGGAYRAIFFANPSSGDSFEAQIDFHVKGDDDHDGKHHH